MICKLAKLVSLLCLLLAGTHASAHLPHDEIVAIAVSPAYATDQTAFASLTGPWSWLLKTTDRGATWTPSQTGLPYGTITSVAVSPAYDQNPVVFAAVTKLTAGFAFKSIDGGANWSGIDAGLPGTQILSLAISPDFAVDQTVLAGTLGDGIFRTTDAGATWSSSSPGSVDVSVIVFSPDFVTDQTVFAATSSGLLKSTDGGQSWANPLPGYAGAVDALAISPAFAQDQTVFMGVSGIGVFRSLNGGSGFALVNTGLQENLVTALAVSPDFTVDQTLLVATNAAIFRSTNAGDLWTPQTSGLDEQEPQTAVHYNAFGFSPNYSQDRTVFLASFEGVHRSTNSADSWRRLDTFSQKMPRDLEISPAFAVDQTLYSSSYGGGVYRSENGGDAWAAVATGLADIFPEPIELSPDFASDNIVYTGLENFVSKSENRGGQWTSNGVAPGEFIITRRMEVSPDLANDGTIFVADDFAAPRAMYKSTDGGDTFLPLNAPFRGPFGMALSPGYASDQTLFVGPVFPLGIYRSQDGGSSWQQVLEDGWALSIALSPNYPTDGIVFAGTRYDGMFKSADGGDTWVAANTGLEAIISIESLAISPDFESDQTVFAGTWARGVYRSTDAGASWNAVGLPGDNIAALAISPTFATDQTVFAGGWEGAYRSTDGGNTWSRVSDILRYDDQNEFVFYDGNWPVFGCQLCNGISMKVSATPQAKVRLTFVGDSVSWIGTKAPIAGIAGVFIDGVFEGQVDLYDPQLLWQQTLFTRTGLGPGEHSVLIVVTGAQNPSSSGRVIFFDALEVGY